MRLKDRVAVITGAAGGLGSEMAREMARQGANVVVSDLAEGACVALAEEIQAMGRRSIAVAVDTSSRAEVDGLVALAQEKLGRIDTMVNNAGVEIVKPLLDTSEEDWDRIFAVNVKGVLFGIQAAVRAMIRQDTGGRIINMASAAGRGGRPLLGAYGASKAAVIHLTQSAALSFGIHNITVNSICPGVIETRMGMAVVDEWNAYAGKLPASFLQASPAALHEIGKPIEVATVAAFLASDDAGYITGQAINVCGGRRLN